MAAHVCPQTRTVGLSAITIIGIVPKIINYMSPFEDRWRQEVHSEYFHWCYFPSPTPRGGVRNRLFLPTPCGGIYCFPTPHVEGCIGWMQILDRRDTFPAVYYAHHGKFQVSLLSKLCCLTGEAKGPFYMVECCLSGEAKGRF